MSTRQQARRRKGSVRQVKYPGWNDERREIWEEDNRVPDISYLGGNSLKVRDYWRERLGPQATFVYFIDAEGLPELKIGYARNPITRLNELQCGNARPLTVRALLLGSKATERALHRFWKLGGFESAHITGEWYGNGLESAILEVAGTIARQQIKDYEEGCDMLYVRDTLPSQILDEMLPYDSYERLAP